LLLAMSLLNDTALAEDVVHDVFARFVEGLHGFRLTGSVKGYLLTCVANRARNLNRDGRPRLSADTVPPVGCTREPPEPNSPVNRLLGNESLQLLAEAMEQLPYEQRVVVALRIYGDLTFKAIGAQQEISVDTVKSRYRYGLKKLRLILNSEETL